MLGSDVIHIFIMPRWVIFTWLLYNIHTWTNFIWKRGELTIMLTVSEIFVPLHWFHVFEMPNLLLGVLKKKYTCGEFWSFSTEKVVFSVHLLNNIQLNKIWSEITEMTSSGILLTLKLNTLKHMADITFSILYWDGYYECVGVCSFPHFSFINLPLKS